MNFGSNYWFEYMTYTFKQKQNEKTKRFISCIDFSLDNTRKALDTIKQEHLDIGVQSRVY